MRTFGEYNAEPRPKYRRRRRRRFAFFAVLVLLLVGLGLWAAAAPPEESLLGVEPPSEPAPAEVPGAGPSGATTEEAAQEEAVASEERLNVLLLGLDRRMEEVDEDDDEGIRTDAIMVAQLDRETGEVRLLSIPRDLYLEVEPGVEDRINSVYARGGVPQTVEVVEDLTNLEIEHHAVVDFQGFEDLVDAMGGVEVELEEEDIPPGLKVEEGRQRLDGRQALLYTRFRDAPGSDLGRIERQQQVLYALREEALQWDSLRKLPEISRAASENAETDLSFGEMVSLGHALMRHGEDGRMETVQLGGEPTTLPDDRQVLVPDPEENREVLYGFY
jgi:LCP family protein required for cell wall assembly